MTINSNLTVGNFAFMTTGLGFTYNPASSQFTLAGAVGVSVTGIAGLSVTFGEAVYNSKGSIVSFTPGLIINSGSLVSLNLSVTASFTVSGVSFSAMNLAFDYNPSINTWALSGGAGVTVAGIASLAVQFGHAADSLHPTATPGVLVSNGSLVQLNMFINTGFNIATAGVNVASFNGELQFTYTTAGSVFSMSGFAKTTILSLATLNAEFGSYVNNSLVAPGLAITNGSLTSLYLTVNSNVGIAGFNFSVNNLALQYTSSNSTFTLSGSASVNLPVVGSATVNFGSNGTSGLVVQNGKLQALNIAVVGNLKFGGATFVATGQGLGLKYKNGAFSVYGSAMLTISSMNIPLNFGAPGDALSFLNGALQPVNITVSGGFMLGGLSVSGNLNIAYQPQTATTQDQLIVTGLATVSTSALTVSVDFGAPPNNTVQYFTSVDSKGNATNATYTSQGLVFQNLLGKSSSGLPPLGNPKLVNADAVFTASLSVPQVLGLRAGANGYVRYNPGSGVVNVVASGFVSALPVSIANTNVNLLTLPATLNYTYTPNGQNLVATIYAGAAGNIVIIDDFVHPVVVTGSGLAGTVANVVTTVQSVVNTIADGAKRAWDSIFNGPLVGAQVYYDPNNNFDFAHDPSAVARADGTSSLVAPAGATGGQLVAIGGTDSASGVVNQMVLTAPYDAASVSPLTTLINDLMQQDGLNEATATVDVNAAFGIAPDTDTDLVDPIIEGLGADQAAGVGYLAEIEVYDVANGITKLLSGESGAPSTMSLSESAFTAIASEMAHDPGASVFLDNPTVLQSLIQQVAAAAGLTVDPTVASDAAQILSAVVTYEETLTNDGSANYMDELTQADVAANGTISPQLAMVASGGANIATLLADYTGSALTTVITGATVSTLDADGPAVSIISSVAQPVGAGDPTSFVFPVYLTTTSPLTAPVTVQYTTVDDTAKAANGDYTPTSGTLTWDPGDTAPQMITVPDNLTNSTTPDLAFSVVLSNPQNATIGFAGAAVGVIEYKDYTTTTTVTGSDPSPTFGDSVTLTATVTNQDPAHSAGTGTVTFRLQDGTILGTATLASGQASITTTDLPADAPGVFDSITAVYSGATTTAANYAPSMSAPLSLTVALAPQTITFAAVPDQLYGAVPFDLNATTSSGLGVNYQIVSGPATFDDNELTITGAGTVVVEASEPGDQDFAAAPPVMQSFVVAPTPLFFFVDDQSMVYGGSVPTLTGEYDAEQLANGDSPADLPMPTITTTATSLSGVGGYLITASGATSPNYTIAFVPGELAIDPAPLIVTPDDQTMTYGGTLPPLTVTYSGFENGDGPASLPSPPAVTTVPANSPVGDYEIDVADGVQGNYFVEEAPGTLTITPAPLVITANDQTSPAGAALPDLTVTYAGLVNGDTPSVFNTAPDMAPLVMADATSASPAGTVSDITPGYAYDPNYDISYSPGTLTITPDINLSTTTTLGTPSPSTYGQTVTLTATVAAAVGTPTGEVEFEEGSTIIGVAPLINGTASLTISTLSAGAQTITAQYLGASPEYSPNASAPITQLVQEVTPPPPPPPPAVVAFETAHWETIRVHVGSGKRAKIKSETVLEIQFSGPLAGTANLGAYRLSTIKSKAVKKKVGQTLQRIPLSSALPASSPFANSVALVPRTKPNLALKEQLQITTADLTDTLGRPMAGNNGQSGGAFVASLTPGGGQSLANTAASARTNRMSADAIDAIMVARERTVARHPNARLLTMWAKRYE